MNIDKTVQVIIEIPKDEYEDIKKFIKGRKDIPSIGHLIYSGYKMHLEMARIAMEAQIAAVQEAMDEGEGDAIKLLEGLGTTTPSGIITPNKIIRPN